MYERDKMGVLKSVGIALVIMALSFVVQIGVTLVCQIGALIFFKKSLLNINSGTAVVSIMYAIVMTGPLMIWYHFLKKDVNGSLAGKKGKLTTPKRLGMICVYALAVQLVMFTVLNFFFVFLQDTKIFKNYIEIMDSLNGSQTSLIYVYTFFLAPVCEEYIFRGIIYVYARKYMSPRGANILQAMCFGVFHMNLIQGVYAFVGGLLFGYIAHRRQSMLESILLHMLVNILGVIAVPPLFMYLETLVSPYILYSVSGIISITGTGLLMKKVR